MDKERLSNAIADNISPVLLPDIEIVRDEGKSVIIVNVARFPGPFFMKSLGSEKGVFVRLGSTNRVAGVLRELDYMEKWGTGYKRIIEDCNAGGYPHPEWEELSTVMRIKFQPHSIQIESGAGTKKLEQVGTKSALSRHQVQAKVH